MMFSDGLEWTPSNDIDCLSMADGHLVANLTDINNSSSRDEIPERDVTCLSSIYLFTTELRMTRPLSKHSSK